MKVTEVDRFSPAEVAFLEPLTTSSIFAVDNAGLVEVLRQRNLELQAQNEELSAFAHTVAHALKNPLGLIVGSALVLEEDCTTMPDEDQHHFLHTLAQTGLKMSRIVDELLLLTQIDQVDVEIKPLDMAGIASEALQRLALMIEEYQAEIILPDTWPTALGYGPWVEEVWANYLSNALKYGGRPPRVELGADTPTNGVVCFWVRDNGLGLTPEAQDRLFTPFTRLDQARAEGHGLGLSIVQRIAERLDGQVGVESRVGQGSVFSFTLPSAL